MPPQPVSLWCSKSSSNLVMDTETCRSTLIVIPSGTRPPVFLIACSILSICLVAWSATFEFLVYFFRNVFFMFSIGSPVLLWSVAESFFWPNSLFSESPSPEILPWRVLAFSSRVFFLFCFIWLLIFCSSWSDYVMILFQTALVGGGQLFY